MKGYRFLACFVLFCFACNRPSTTALSNTSSSGSKLKTYDYFDIDVFGNTYHYSDVELIKVTSENDTLNKFSLPFTSNITKVSVVNPNKILIFSRDQQKLWILESTLSLLEEKRLDVGFFGDVPALVRGSDYNILLFSNASKKLIKINNQDQILYESDTMWDISDGIQNMYESNLHNLLVTNESNLLLYDDFGNFIKSIPTGTLNLDFIDFKKGVVYILDTEAKLLSYIDIKDPLLELQKYPINSDLDKISDMKVFKNQLFIKVNGIIHQEEIK